MSDPIYKTKDGQQVTHNQLIASGYDEDRIGKGLKNGILTNIGDTNSPDQTFKTKDGQNVSYNDLIGSGYSEERINKGVQNGILIADELPKKKETAAGIFQGIGQALQGGLEKAGGQVGSLNGNGQPSEEENHDDPIGNALKPYKQAQQKALEDYTSANKIVGGDEFQSIAKAYGSIPAKQNYDKATKALNQATTQSEKLFPNTQGAVEFLTQLSQKNDGKLPENNKTVDLALKRIQEKSLVNDAVSKNQTFEDFATNLYGGKNANEMAESKAGEYVHEALNNPSVIEKAKENSDFYQKYLDAKGNFNVRFPSAVNKRLGTDLGQIMEDNNMNGWFYSNPGVEKADKAAQMLKDNGTWDDKDLAYYKIKIRPVVEAGHADRIIPLTDLAHKVGYSLYEGVQDYNKSMRGAVNFLGGNFLDPHGNSLFQNAGLLQTNQDAKREAEQKQFGTSSVEAKGLKGLIEKPLTVAAQIAPMILGSAIGVPEETNMALMFGSGNEDGAAQIIKGDDIKSRAQRLLYTTAMTGADMFFMKMLPINKMMEANKAVEPEIKKMISSLASDEISQAEIKPTLLNAVGNYMKTLPKEIINTGNVLTAYQYLHKAGDAIAGGRDLKSETDNRGFVDDYLNNLLSGSGLAAFSALGTAAKQNKPTLDGKVYQEYANNYDAVKSMFEQRLKEHPEESASIQEKLNNLDHIKQVNDELNAKTDSKGNQKYSDEQKQKVLALSLRGKVAKEKASTIPDKQLQEPYKQEVEKTDIQKAAILSGQNPDEVKTDNEIKIERLQKDKELSDKKFKADREKLDGRTPDDRPKIEKLEEDKKRADEDHERELAKLQPKEITPEPDQQKMEQPQAPTVSSEGDEKLKGEEGLSYLLNDVSEIDLIGDERSRNLGDEISLYKSDNGSYRYVKYENGEPVSAIQIMSKDGKNGQIANVYTEPSQRRKGYATELLNKAKEQFENIEHSELGKSELGDAFAKSDNQQPLNAGKGEEVKGGNAQSRAKKVYKDIGEIDEPSDARGLALEYLAGGGKVSEESINDIAGRVKRAQLNTGAKEKKTEEVKARDYVTKDGKNIDEIAHSIWDNLPEELKNKITTQDLKNELNDVVNSHNTRLSAATEFRDRYIVNEANSHLSEGEAKYNSEQELKQYNDLVDQLPESQINDIVAVLEKYKDKSGKIDWREVEKDSNGFDPDILSLTEETQKSLYDLIEKNIKSGQSERGNTAGENSGKKEGTKTSPQEVSEKPIIPKGTEPIKSVATKKEIGANEGIGKKGEGTGKNASESKKEVDLPQIKKDANDIITGKKVFERFSPDEQRGLTEGGANHVEASILLAAGEGAGGKDNATPEAQENSIEAYAKEKGIWTDNTTQNLTDKYGEPIASGEEAIVWYDPKTGKVIKTQDTFQYENLQQKLDGITLHNTHSPEAPLKVLGYGRNEKGDFQVIVEQPFIKGEKLTPPEIKKFLESTGFKEDENGHFSNGETIIEDVHTGNAIKTPEGNIVIIDPIMRLNTPEQGYGGERKIKNEINKTGTAAEEGTGESTNVPRNTSDKSLKNTPPEATGSEISPPSVNEPTGGGGAEADPELTKIANAVNDELIKGKFGVDALDGIIGQLQDTDLSKIYDVIKEKVKKGTINPKLVRERVMTAKSGSAADQAVLLYDMADLKGKEKGVRTAIIDSTDPKEKELLQRQLTEVQNEMMDNALANRFIGRDWHNIGKIRQQWINKDFNIVDMRDEYMASKGISELTPEQEKYIQKFHDTIKDLEVQRDKAKSDLDKAITENEVLKMENLKLQELKNKATNQKRADRGKKSEEAIQKSNERIQKAKDELKKLRGNLGSGIDPRTGAWVGKIAAEYVYQGVVKLEELVSKVLDAVKDVFPAWTEKDVRQHLFGEKIDTEKYYEAGKKYNTSSKELQKKIRAYNELKKAHALKMFEWQKERRSDIMAKRPFKERAIDGLLRWQRFAVLSYPTTILKLIAVVGHQVVLKPIKFLIQKGLAQILPKGITSKQRLWGDPSWRSLGKYYSAFVRNFSLANLREQFSGIDTKEILYGKSSMYDEWAAAKGFLEMPGRSHGYIKSFIKNPEFQFAQENIATHYIGKMAEIEEQLKNPELSEEKKNELKSEYDNWDITNPDVMEKINKLSLEHGRWAILMNDSKFVDKFRNWADQKTIGGAFMRSEAPILKIPVNYVSRAFATKYGLIRSIVGKGRWESKENHFPGIVELIFKGTKDLTPEQADILGRTLTIGTMGAAFFALGYIMSKKIKVNDDGSVDVFGMHIPKNFVHSPELESFFSGVETNQGQPKSGFLKSFIESDIDIAKKSPFTSMLKYGFIPNVAAALLSKDKEKIGGKVVDAVAKKVTDFFIPGAVKQTAGALDTKKPGFQLFEKPISRKPVGDDLERFWQTVEMAIPGLRENVQPTGYDSFTEQDYKDPRVAWVKKDWGMELPNTSPTSETITEEDKQFEDKLSTYSETIQENYKKAHKENLFTILGDIHEAGTVFVKPYKNAKGETVYHVRVPQSEQGRTAAINDGFEEQEIKKLNDQEKTYVLKEAQTIATKKTKKEMFNQ